MKKIILLLLVICMTLCFGSCNQNSEQKEPQNTDFIALIIVEEVNDTSIIGTIDQTDTKVLVPNWFFGTATIEPLTFLTVSTNGEILETYPSQFAKINYMEYLSPTGKIIRRTGPETEEVTQPENTTNTHTVFVEKYDGEIPIKKKLLNNDALIIIVNTTDMLDGTEFICNCPPDYTIIIDGIEYLYHSKSGLIFIESHAFIVKDKEVINNVLNKYLGGIYNGN